jgi:aminoglycoside/choline kinase family phosphotransferase
MKKPTAKEYFIESFLKESGLPENDYTLSMLAGDGSARLFQRLKHRDIGKSYILMQNPPKNDSLKKENLAYLKIGNHMLAKNLPVPRIFKHDLNRGFFVLEDMGDWTLQDESLKSDNRIKIYENVIETLLRLQIEGKENFDTTWCCQTPFYDSSLMREKEAWYFRDSFLRDYIQIETDLAILDKSFEHIISMAEKAERNYLLHRDFQSRNIMYRRNGIAILDWQGARLGPLAYDFASLLFDPYVALSTHERIHLTGIYISLLKDTGYDAVESFKRYFPYIALMRNLQVLGAYSFLSLRQGKTYFEKYIPVALKSLEYLLDETSEPALSPMINIVRELSR